MHGLTRFARVRVFGAMHGSVDAGFVELIRRVGTVGRVVGRWQDE
jgi:hypothetical protein